MLEIVEEIVNFAGFFLNLVFSGNGLDCHWIFVSDQLCLPRGIYYVQGVLFEADGTSHRSATHHVEFVIYIGAILTKVVPLTFFICSQCCNGGNYGLL